MSVPAGRGEPQNEESRASTEVFVSYRELLFSVVYNMLGSVADTEDVLQETWLAWVGRTSRPEGREIENPRAYLVRIAVNQALARQASINRRRETYVGPWLPEPLVDGTDAVAEAADAAKPALRAESVSMALLIVLETLTPLERAVFVLHEAFGYTLTEIAGILDRSPAAVRQLAHRARAHVEARRPRFQTNPKVRRQVVERFITAALGGDLAALMEMLAPDVTMWTDGGGKVRTASLRPVSGRDKVVRLLAGYTSRAPEDIDIKYRMVNGDPSAVIFSEESPYAVLVMDLNPEGDQVEGIYAVINPEKLTRVPSETAPDSEE
jgi:RNA polymerase sigma-70 factor (ECF subfamily)